MVLESSSINAQPSCSFVHGELVWSTVKMGFLVRNTQLVRDELTSAEGRFFVILSNFTSEIHKIHDHITKILKNNNS